MGTKKLSSLNRHKLLSLISIMFMHVNYNYRVMKMKSTVPRNCYYFSYQESLQNFFFIFVEFVLTFPGVVKLDPHVIDIH